MVILFLVLWELATSVFGISQGILPGPIDIWSSLVSFQDIYITAAVDTVDSALLGYVLGAALGIGFAIVFNEWDGLRRMFMPILVLTFVVPKIVFAPILILWLGAGVRYFVLVPMLLVFFPVLENTLTGLRTVPDGLTDIGELYQSGKWFNYRNYLLPHALPDIFAGLKIGATQALVGIIVAEFIAPEQGLGQLMIVSLGRGDTVFLWGSIFLIGVIGITLYKSVELIESRVVFWQDGVTNR